MIATKSIDFFFKKRNCSPKIDLAKKNGAIHQISCSPRGVFFFFSLDFVDFENVIFFTFFQLIFHVFYFFFYFLPFFSLSSIEIDRFCVVVVVFFRCCTPTMCGATMFSWSIEFYRVVFFWRGIDFYRVRVALLGRTVFFLVTGFCNIYRVFF